MGNLQEIVRKEMDRRSASSAQIRLGKAHAIMKAIGDMQSMVRIQEAEGDLFYEFDKTIIAPGFRKIHAIADVPEVRFYVERRWLDWIKFSFGSDTEWYSSMILCGTNFMDALVKAKI